jgi:hypothetical protein
VRQIFFLLLLQVIFFDLVFVLAYHYGSVCVSYVSRGSAQATAV